MVVEYRIACLPSNRWRHQQKALDLPRPFSLTFTKACLDSVTTLASLVPSTRTAMVFVLGLATREVGTHVRLEHCVKRTIVAATA